MADTGTRIDAFGAYYFAVEIEGIESAFFRSCSGLKSEAEVVEIVEGGENNMTHKLIGHTRFPNIVLKRGFSDPRLWERRADFRSTGKPIQRFNGTIVQYGPGQKKAARWRFENGWICKWEGPDFDASKNEISIESIEIAHGGLTFVRGE